MVQIHLLGSVESFLLLSAASLQTSMVRVEGTRDFGGCVFNNPYFHGAQRHDVGGGVL